MTKTGTGTFTVSGSNSYSGTTLVSGGTLQAGAANAFSPNSLVNVTGTLGLNNNSNVIANLTGSGTVTLGSGTLSLGGDNNSETFSGGISGTGGVTKTGTGTFTLSGTSNTYSGATTVNGGVLQAGVANSFSSSSDVTLANTLGVALDLNNFSNTIGSLAGGGGTGGNVTGGM
ncbi:MAG: autotransporter-associated beta strand repeat-containing protein [Actinobacteria bacterium]|nr:autotransporter-associated beta strand repeat-containing protein [Actinomycetota bacterium]